MKRSRSAINGSARWFLACAATVSLCKHAGAANCIWLNPVNGLYSDSTKWSCPVYPWESDTAAFDKSGAYTVSSSGNIMLNTLDAADGQVTFAATSAFSPVYGLYRVNMHGGNLTLAGAKPQSLQALYSLTVENNSQINISAGSMFWIGSSSLGTISINNGTVNLNAPGATSPTFQATKLTSIGAGAGSGAMTFQNSATGSFLGIDIANSLVADTVGALTIQTGADVTAGGNVNIGATAMSSQSGTLTLTGSGSTFVQSGATTLTVGASSGSTAALNIDSGGAFTTGSGLITINKTGTLKLGPTSAQGSFTANGNMLVNGGRLDFNSLDFVLAAGKTFTAQNDATVNFTGPTVTFFVQNGSTYTFESGSKFTTRRPMNIGDPSNGLMIFRGAGTTMTSLVPFSPTSNQINLGRNHASGTLSFEDGAAGSIEGRVGVADSGTSDSTGTLSITCGSSLSLKSFLTIANQNVAGQVGKVIIDGTGSSLTTATSAIVVGSAANGTALINIGVDHSGGALNTGTGGLRILKTGSVNVGSDFNVGVLNANADVQINGGVLNIAQAGRLNLADGHSISIQGGGILSVGGPLTIPASSSIDLADGHVVIAANAGVAHLGHLNFAGSTDNWSGSLDLTTNSLVIDSGDMAAVTNQIKNGIAGATGIFSSTAGPLLRLGSMSNNDGSGGAIYNSFQSIGGLDGDEILVRYTRVGDLNLDGTVTISDFIDLASHFNSIGGATWQMGDVNYDGSVTIADFVDLASNFGQSISGEAISISDADAAMLGAFAASSGVSAVPEPTWISIIAAVASLLFARRRKLPLARLAECGVP